MQRLLTWLLIVGLLISVTALAAQDATEEPTSQTYSDQLVTFEYPAGWVLSADDASNTVALGNTQTALEAITFSEFAEGDVQVLVVEAAEPFFAGRLGIPLESGVSPETALSLVVPEDIPVEAFAFDDGREAAEIIFTDEDAGANTVIWLIDLGEGARGALLITGRTEDVEAVEADLLALAESFTVSPIEVAGVTADGIELDQAFTNSTGTHRLNYPDGWLIAENQRNVIFFATSGEALGTENLADLQRGEVVGLIYLAANLIPEYVPDNDIPLPVDVVSFFATLGVTAGYEQIGEVTTLSFDGAEGAVSFAVNTVQSHERLVLAVDTGEDVSTMLAYTDPGSMDVVRPVLEAITASIDAGEFATATEEAID